MKILIVFFGILALVYSMGDDMQGYMDDQNGYFERLRQRLFGGGQDNDDDDLNGDFAENFDNKNGQFCTGGGNFIGIFKNSRIMGYF